VTHPFHPLRGRVFEVLSRRLLWDGGERIYFRDDAGTLRGISAGWTDLGKTDVFVMISGGRALFRVDDLSRLCRIVCGG
jgi:Family of unknown function (DUF5372)